MTYKRAAYDLVLNLTGTFLYAGGINCFVAPHNIAPGGASGIAVLINYLTGCPIGLFVFLFNIPLVILIILKKYLAGKFIARTAATICSLSIITDLLVSRLPTYHGDPLLAALFGGALMGTGLAMVHLGASNTGGISLLALIIQKWKPRYHVGMLISGLNIGVVLASGIVYRNIDSILYAIVTVYISGIFMDKILNSSTAKNLMIVISESTDKVRAAFLQAHKGITIVKGEGGYTCEPQRVILCAVTKNDCENMQKIVHEVDKHALIIIAKTSQIVGKGFQHII